MPKIVVSGGKRVLQVMSSEHRKLSEASDLVASINDATEDGELKAKATAVQDAICALIVALPPAATKAK